jgi:NADH-quinone oxidoreductase subunit H
MFPDMVKGNAFLTGSAAAAGMMMPIVWFCAKALVILFVYIWIRGTLPRFRYDQLMSFAWTFLFPVALINLFLVALWVALT